MKDGLIHSHVLTSFLWTARVKYLIAYQLARAPLWVLEHQRSPCWSLPPAQRQNRPAHRSFQGEEEWRHMHRSAAQGRRVGQGHRDWCIHGHTGVCWAYGADQDEKLGGLREAAAFALVTVAPCSPLLER